MDDFDRIYFVTWHARCLIRRHFSIESCILTTKVLSHLLTDLGIKNVPVGVGIVALNKRATELAERGEGWVDDPVGAAVTCTFRGDIDSPSSEGWWGAHLTLAAWTDEGEWLIDGSVDQFTMPDLGIVIEPAVIALPEERKLWDWLDSNDPVSYTLPDGGSITYEPHMEDTSYQPTMDWEETMPGEKGYDHIAERVLGLLEVYEAQGGPLRAEWLPPLPPSVSKRTSSPEEFLAHEFRAFTELGMTRAEVVGRIKREEERERKRLTKKMNASMDRAAEAVKLTGQQAAALTPTLQRVAGLFSRHPGPTP